MAGVNMVYKIGVVIGIFICITILKWFENRSVKNRRNKWKKNR